MRKKRFEKKDTTGIIVFVLSLLLFATVLAVVQKSLHNASGSLKEEGLHIAQQAVMRAVVSCYAVEGAYPESYEYLKENYGLKINEDRYIIHYSNFASNILPTVTVLAREEGQ